MKIVEAKKLLQAVHEHKDKLTIDYETKLKINKARKAFKGYYEKQPKKFIEDYIRILHGKTNEEVPFILNAAQVSLVDAMKDDRWLAAPKARQLGITTLTNALALHHSLFVKNANVICMAVKTDNAVENLRRIKTMFSTMPKWVQETVLQFDEKGGHQNNTQLWSFKSLLSGSNVKLEVASANSEDGTRGKTPTFLHWTEVAFSEIAEQIFTSVFPALNRRKDSKIILESTGNGNQGFYYEVCTGIRKGFKVVFMPWFMDEDYRLDPFPMNDDDKEQITDLMGVKELPEHLDEGQLWWYKKTSETIGKAKCQQEYPVNVEQVFQATSISFFSAKTIQKLVTKKPIHHMNYSGGFLAKTNQGPCAVWENPNPNYEYLLVADVSEGVLDPSSIQIFNPKGEEVLHWHELLQPDDIVTVISELGKRYHNARVVVESNGIGQYILNTLRSHYFYPNLHHEDGRLGMRTTVATKPVMLSTLQEHILNDKLIINNPVLGEEMSTFQADKLAAQKTAHDDVVMSSAISAWCFSRNPPKIKRVRSEYRDYDDILNKNNRPRRQFIIGGSNG